MISRRTLLLAAAGLLVTGCNRPVTTPPAPEKQPWASPWGSPWTSRTVPFAGSLIAHRGTAGVDHENTIGAMLALPDWVDGIEIDVRLTSDGVPVLMHDKTVDRNTDGTGAVAELTAAEFAVLHTRDGPPPTLADYLSACDGRPWSLVLLDMKDDSDDALTATLHITQGSPVADACVVMLRPGDGPYRLRSIDGNIPWGSFGSGLDTVDAVVADLNAYDGHLALTPPGHYAEHRDAAEIVRSAGFLAGASTTNDPEVLGLVRSDDMDIVLSDITDDLADF